MKQKIITTVPTDKERIIKEYQEHLYAHKFNNLDACNAPIPGKIETTKTHTRRDDLNRPMSILKTGSIINKFPKKRV